MKTSVWQIILREPYRIFFPLAVLSGITGVGYWFLFGVGIVKTYSAEMHSAIQMQVCMGAFIAGFLMTALPKMTSSVSASGFEFFFQLIFTISMLAFYLAGESLIANLFYGLWLLSLAFFFLKRFKEGRSNNPLIFTAPPVELIWVPAGIFFALIGIVYTILAKQHENLSYFARQLTNQSFVLCVVIGVGSFMGARFTGRFRTTKKSISNPCEITKQAQSYRREIFFQLTGAGFLFLSFVLEGFRYPQTGYTLRALVITIFFFASGVLPKWPKTSGLYVWILWLSFWLFALGFWGAASHLQYRIESLHVSFLGGLGLMTYAVITMVVVTHAGKPERMREPLLILWIILVGLLTSLGVRLAAVFIAKHYYQLLGFSSVIWVIVALAWLIFARSYLYRWPDPKILEAHHERMKKTLSKS